MKLLEFFCFLCVALLGIHAAPTDPEITANATEHSLVSRDDFRNVECKPQGYPVIRCPQITAGLSYMDNRNGYNIGANTRHRVSCSYNSAIYYENNENFAVGVTGKSVADSVRDLLSRCTFDCRPDQAFSGVINYSGHRVIVAGTAVFADSC